MVRRSLPIQAVILLVVMLVSAGCQKEEPDYFQGYVEGEYVYVSSTQSGVLKKLVQARGQIVEKDAALFELDPNPQALQLVETRQRIAQARAKFDDIGKGRRPSELAVIEAKMKKARAAFELAERDYERRREIFDSGGSDVISEEEVDRFRTDVLVKDSEVRILEADLVTAKLGGRQDAIAVARREIDALEASLEQLDWQIAEKKVAAPASGFIQDTLYREGELILAGRPVISLLPPENIKIRFFVPQRLLPTIELGTPVKVHLDGIEGKVPAQVSFISSLAEFTPPVIYSKESRTKLVFMIEASFAAADAKKLRPGQPLEVYFQ